MTETTKNLLNLDPICEAEELIGKRCENWEHDESVAALGLFMLANKYKEEHLKSIGDTYFDIPFNDFITIIKEYGFECGYYHDFKDDGKKQQEEVIYFHKDKGLILYANSCFDKIINDAKVYGEVEIDWKNHDRHKFVEAMYHCSHGDNGNGTMYFNLDGREGLISNLEVISDTFVFSKQWTKAQRLWFLNYVDTEKENYDYNEINKQKILSSMPEVQKIIYG